MKLNNTSYIHAKNLIKQGKIIKDNDEKLPNPTEENTYMTTRGIPDLARWYLGIEDDLDDWDWDIGDSSSMDVRDKYRFPVGDLRYLYQGNLEEIIRETESEGFADINKAAKELLELLQKRRDLNEE